MIVHIRLGQRKKDSAMAPVPVGNKPEYGRGGAQGVEDPMQEFFVNQIGSKMERPKVMKCLGAFYLSVFTAALRLRR